MGETGDSEEKKEARGLEEDRLSLRSAKERNGTQPDSPVKEKKPGMLKSLRESFRRAGERSPLSPNVRGSTERQRTDIEGRNVDPEMASPTSLHQPLSPSSSVGSPMTSPLKSLGGLFQRKEEDGVEGSPSAQKKTSHSRSRSDPTITLGGSIRQSFRLGKKDKTSKQEQLQPVAEVTVDEQKEREKKERVDIRESYTLPEIPPTPLSIMEINKLIEMEVLEEAHLNLLSLRQEFQKEQERCSEEVSSMELAKKEKDLNLLYGAMRDKVKAVVRNSNTFPSRNKELLVHVARVIQEEEKREGEPGGIMRPGGWRGSWKEAVGEGVQAKLGSVHLDGKEQNISWLSIHLGLLGTAIVEDLENVKKDLLGSYPPSFNVFSTYVNCYRLAVGKHLRKLLQEITELKDYYALLDWIINRYKSEKIMGSLSLLPEMKAENTALCVEEDFLDQLKGKYCNRVQEDLKASLDRILMLEYEEVWNERKAPETDNGQLISDIHMDIWTMVKSNVVNSRKIDVQLERVVCACLEELKQFPKRFQSEFEKVCVSLRDDPLCADYQITYINTFSALKEHMEGYRDSCPTEVNHLSKEVDGLVHILLQDLEVQFKNNTRPFLRRLMTRKWLSTDEDFKKLYSQTEKLSQQSAQMRPPYAQTLVSNLHYHVVKEFVSQLMKKNYSCKNRKHERAARKMQEQWTKLRALFQDMETEHEWLHPLGDNLSEIIGQKNARDIKNHLQPLVENYPDISKKHLAAVLYFRGLVRGRERHVILQRFTELRKKQENPGDQRRALFTDIQVAVNTDCLAGMPFSCLSFLLPDS